MRTELFSYCCKIMSEFCVYSQSVGLQAMVDGEVAHYKKYDAAKIIIVIYIAEA